MRGDFPSHNRVVGRIGDDRDAAIILGRAAEHRGAADVDVFDGMFEGHVRFVDGLLEGIEVDHDEVDWFDPVRLRLFAMVFVVA